MTVPLDPAIAKIIPTLPLRDPAAMTPESAREALRAVAAGRAALPPPPVAGVEDIAVKGGAGRLAARVYRGASSNAPTDWRASPLRAESLAGVAPAVICTAWFDPLRDEGIAYAKALQAAGVAVRHHDGLGLIHGFFGGIGEVSDAARLEAQRARADFKALLATRT